MSRRSRWLGRKLAHSLFASPVLVVGLLMLDANEHQRALGRGGGNPTWFDGAGLIMLLLVAVWLIWIWWACE